MSGNPRTKLDKKWIVAIKDHLIIVRNQRRSLEFWGRTLYGGEKAEGGGGVEGNPQKYHKKIENFSGRREKGLLPQYPPPPWLRI